jgi:hypothetical protein
MTCHEKWDAEFFEGLFDYYGYDEDEIVSHVINLYKEDLQKLGLLSLKDANKQDHYEECVRFLKEELNGLTEYATKHEIDLP